MNHDNNDRESLEAFIETFAYKLTENRRKRLDLTIKNRTRHFTMVMEDLKDAHNISAVIRTSEVFGLQDVHIIEELNPYNISKAILRGSIKWLNIYRYKQRKRCMEHLKSKGYQIAVASSRTDTSLQSIDFTKPTAFYLGSESIGNHPDTLKLADTHFKIPQYGLTESMNVSVCAGVLMSTLAGFMEKEGRDKFALSPEEQTRLRADYYERSVLGMGNNSPLNTIE